MPRGSSPKRERQYEHIKDSAEQRGESTGRAEEIAARTVNQAGGVVLFRGQEISVTGHGAPTTRPTRAYAAAAVRLSSGFGGANQAHR
jgi:hypothetical protein